MFKFECLTNQDVEQFSFCEVLCGPNSMCGPDYGVGCTPQCDPANDW